MMVKICGVTTLEDAEAAIEAGAHAIGFNFYSKSPRYITADMAFAISSKLPVYTLKVGVFVDASIDMLRSTAAIAKLDVVQLHGQESPGNYPAELRIWKAFRVAPEWDSAAVAAYDVDAVVLDGPMPGTGKTWVWKIDRGIRQRIILAGGLDASNVQEAIRAIKPWGVDACSRIEIAPGRKDHDKMRKFVKAALAGDAA
jgi:phosphoribosylanthranilate isomerase